MANNSIGGFFVNLGMKTDGSFKAGEDALKRFIGTATKVAALSSVKIAGAVENANLKLAKSIGISAEDLNAWQMSASKAGISAGSLTSSMAQLENKMQKLKLGEVDQNLAKNLGMLGIGYDQFANMNATQRMSAVFNAAGGMEDQRKAAVLVGETLGSSAREYYDWLALSGRTLSQELAESKALNFTTQKTMEGAAAFNAEFNGLVETTKSLGLLISSKIGDKLTPVIKGTKEWVKNNKELINSGIDIAFDKIGQAADLLGDAFVTIGEKITGEKDPAKILKSLANSIGSIVSPAFETSVKLLGDLGDALSALWNGDWDALGGSLKNFLSDLGVGFAEILGLDVKSKDASSLQKEAEEQYKGGGVKGLVKGATLQTAAISKVVSGEDARANLRKQIENMRKEETPTNMIGIPQYADTPLTSYSKDFLKLLVLGIQSGAYNPAGYRGYSDEELELLKQIESDSNNSTETLTGSGLKVYNKLIREKNKASKNDALGIKDGIIRPNGQVTRVAPDDWVFAARNLGDLASAFMPRSMPYAGTGNASYTITQEFTFNGSSRDMASEVMRQAYRGTQSGLLAAMNQNTQRMQLMPGMR